MIEFASDENIRQIPDLVAELLRYVCDDEMFFISDEATIWEVWSGAPEEVLERCVRHYGVPISRDDLKLPLWRLLPILDERRKQQRS